MTPDPSKRVAPVDRPWGIIVTPKGGGCSAPQHVYPKDKRELTDIRGLACFDYPELAHEAMSILQLSLRTMDRTAGRYRGRSRHLGRRATFGLLSSSQHGDGSRGETVDSSSPVTKPAVPRSTRTYRSLQLAFKALRNRADGRV